MNKWIKYFLLYLGGTIIGMSQLKITPVIKPLSEYLNTSLTQMSLLTSIFTISGIFIAIPGGMLVTKFGAKKLLIIVMSLLALGNVIGIFSSSFSMLLFSRVIEGISFSTIVMIGVVLINYWFKDSPKLGVAIGLFTTFPAAASLISMNIFLPLSEKYGLFFSWYLIGILAVVLTVLYVLFIDGPKEAEESTSSQSLKKLFVEATKNKRMWILGFLQGCMAFVLYAYIALYPVLFNDYYHLSQSTSNFYSGLFGLFGIPFGVVAGYLIDHSKRPGIVLTISFLMMSAACFFAPFLQGKSFNIIIQVFILSAGAMLASSSVTILVPKSSKKDSLIGYSMSFVNLFYYTSIVIGAPLISSIIENFSWFIGLQILTLISVLGVLGSIIYTNLSQTNN